MHLILGPTLRLQPQQQNSVSHSNLTQYMSINQIKVLIWFHFSNFVGLSILGGQALQAHPVESLWYDKEGNNGVLSDIVK